MARSDRDIIKDLKTRRVDMDDEYNAWKPHFVELRDNIKPSRGRFSIGENRKGSTINKKIIDPTAAESLKTFKSGMTSGVASQARPWFKIGLTDKDLMEDHDVKVWLSEVQKRMYEVLRGSNVYRSLPVAFEALGIYGTYGGMMVPHFDNIVHFKTFPMGRYRIATDEDGNVVALHWDIHMTVRQIVNQFGLDAVSQDVRTRHERNELGASILVSAAVECRGERDLLSPLASDMVMGVYYWEENKTEKLLLNSGYSFKGLLCPRWEVEDDDQAFASMSPGMEALGACVHLQAQQRQKALAIAMSVTPTMQQPAGMKSRYRGIPGRSVSVPTMDIQKGGMRPTHEVRTDIQGMLEDIEDTRRSVQFAFYDDLFRMISRLGISGVKDVTATAINKMSEEMIIAIGPALENVNSGLLQPIVEGTFHYMQEADILPPPPDSMDGQSISVEFIGLFAQAQRSVGIAAIERTIGFVGTLAQVKPEALDLLNEDSAVREFAEQVGPPPEMIRSEREIEEIRAQRAQAQQQQQMIDSAEPMASAANLISEANQRGEEGLAQGGGF